MLEGSVMRRVAHGTQIHIHDSLHVVLQEHVILCYVPTANLRKFSSIQSLSHVQLFATPWTAARQASMSTTNSQTMLKFMSIESVMPSNRLILCCPLLLLSIFASIRVFSKDSVLHIRWLKY